MKLIAVVGAFTGIFFFNSGIAQNIEVRGDANISNSVEYIKVRKIFDSETQMVCYLATASGSATDCLKGTGKRTELIVTRWDHHFGAFLVVNRVLDPEENIVCYITSSYSNIPKSYGSAPMITIDCEKI